MRKHVVNRPGITPEKHWRLNQMDATKRTPGDFDPHRASQVLEPIPADPQPPGETPDPATEEPIRCASPPCSMPEIED